MFVHRLKLRPPQLLSTWIERPQVERRFAADASVFSIVAGPGYGKTVLAARLYAAWPGPKLWYGLDEADGDLAVFAAHVQTMIGSLQPPSVPEGDWWRLGSPKEVGLLFAEMLADLPPGVLLVFDDVHALEGSRALAALGEFVERATRSGASFIVTGRSMPLPLHAIAAGARLARASASDLAFDDAEARAYLGRTMPSGGDASVLDRLVERAEGWPAGLALVASSTALSDGRPGAPADASDEETRRLLFDYLAAEVLDGLGDRERRFLLETSILDELERDLCDAVTGRADAAEILPSLARRGLFVTRHSGDAYGAHRLFREFLRHSLALAYGRDEIAMLHRAAAIELARRGDSAGSIAHRLDAGDVEEAATELETHAFDMLATGLLARVDSFLRRVGDERIETRPALLVARARLDQLRGDWDKALACADRAMRAARERALPDVLAEAVRAASQILASRGESDRLRDLARAALAFEPPPSDASRSRLSMLLGAMLLGEGRSEEALAVFRDIMPAIVAAGDLALQGMVVHNTAVAHVRRGEPYAALAMYERALKVKRSAGQRVSALLTLANLIFVTRVLGDLDEAERLAQQLLAESYDVGNTTMIANAHENEGALKLLRGDVDGAARAYREAQRSADPADAHVLPDILHGLAQTALAAGDLAEADSVCAKAIGMLGGATQHQHLAALLVTRAETALAREEYERALALFTDALDRCERGTDAVLAASTALDAAAGLMRLAPRLASADAASADRAAAAAAMRAIALVHERDYRFLTRTKAAALAELREHFRRWRIGAGLVPGLAPATESLRIELLGGLRVIVAGEPLAAEAWKRRKARDIFAYLVSLRGRSVPRTRLIDLYWPDTDADAAHDNLRVTISAIRKAVGDVVKFESNGYRFVAPAHTTIDTVSFDAHVEGARQALASGTVETARHGFMAAVELYRGEFLEGIEEGGWQWRERERLHAACLEAVRWLASDAGGDPSFRRLALDRLLELAPFDIEAVRMRLDSLVAELRVGEARRDYEAWKTRYRVAVGAEPPEIWSGGEPAHLASVRDLSQRRTYDTTAPPVTSGMARA